MSTCLFLGLRVSTSHCRKNVSLQPKPLNRDIRHNKRYDVSGCDVIVGTFMWRVLEGTSMERQVKTTRKSWIEGAESSSPVKEGTVSVQLLTYVPSWSRTDKDWLTIMIGRLSVRSEVSRGDLSDIDNLHLVRLEKGKEVEDWRIESVHESLDKRQDWDRVTVEGSPGLCWRKDSFEVHVCGKSNR